MTLIPKAPKALLHLDAILIQRSSGLANSEGNPTGSRTTVATTRGTVASLQGLETLTAAQRSTIVEKALAVELGTDLKEGDWVAASGVQYEVVAVEDRRLYRRALLRVVK